MATLVRNHFQEGVFVLPAIYGSKELGPGIGVIIADTPSNVMTQILAVAPSAPVDVTLVPDGQTGAIVPAISPAVANQTGQATITNTTATIATVPTALLAPLTSYQVRARVSGIGTQASSAGTKGKGLASELVGAFTTNSSGVPAQTGSTTSVSVIKDAALDAGDVPTLSIVSNVITVQGVAAATETLDYAAVIDVAISAT